MLATLCAVVSSVGASIPYNLMATLTNIAKSATATIANVAKNRYVASSGGEVFYGFLFLFTITSIATGPSLANASKNSGTITNVAKS